MPDNTLECLEKITQATSVDAVWSLQVEEMQRYGFDRLLYGMTRNRTEDGLGDTRDMLILSNHDPRYLETFVGKSLYFHAPMTKWAVAHTGSASWRRLHDDADSLSAEEREVVAFNRKFGITAGYTISFHDVRKRNRAAVALTARADLDQDAVDAVWEEHGASIRVVNEVCHLKIGTLPYRGLNAPLTARQREVLEFVGDGKTSDEIASALGLTRTTVEKHLRRARETLGVSTTAQAVLKAAFQNQIFLFDDVKIY